MADNIAVEEYFKTYVNSLNTYDFKINAFRKYTNDPYTMHKIEKAYNLSHLTCDLVIRFIPKCRLRMYCLLLRVNITSFHPFRHRP